MLQRVKNAYTNDVINHVVPGIVMLLLAGAPDQMLRLALSLGLGSSGQSTGSFVGNFSHGKRSTTGATGTRICHTPGMHIIYYA